MKTALLLTLSWVQLFSGTGAFAAPKTCAEVFSGENLGAMVFQSPTEGLISYLGRLLEDRIILPTDLETFISKLESGKITNPISAQQKSNSSAHTIHFEALQRLISA